MREVAKIIREIQEAKGPKKKMEVLSTNPNNNLLRQVLYVTYNRRYNYGISARTMIKLRERAKNEQIKESKYESIFDLLKKLNNSNINNELRDEIVAFLQQDPELEWLYAGMIINDLAIGIGITSINKVFQGLIPVFAVQLAAAFNPELLEENEEFTLTEKLNGVRCLSFPVRELVSRQGKKFKGMIVQINELDILRKDLPSEDFVFDGELIHANPEGIEDNANFRRTIAVVNSDAEEKSQIIYRIFDIINLSEFEDKKGNIPYRLRRTMLDILSKKIKDLELKNIEIVPAIYTGKDQSKIMEYLEEYIKKGKEGIMLNKSECPYECKRHSGIIKVKKMKRVDLLVTDIVEGRRNFERTLGAVIVEYKGYSVRVGSGFSKEQREYFWKYPEMIKGRIIEVQFYEETKSKGSDKLSLQFPVFRGLREDKLEPSYD